MKKQLLLATLFAANSAIAADWEGEAELGYILLDGNSESQSLNSKLDVNRESGKWRNNFHAEASNSSSSVEQEDGTKKTQRTAEKYLVSSKADYKFTERSYAFGLVTWEDDNFSGFDYQATATLGYGRQLIKTDTMKLFMEAGPGYRIDEPEVGDTQDEVVAHFGEKFEWKISETSKFRQELEVDSGDENTIAVFQVGLTSNLTESFAMRAGYKLKHTENPAIGKKHADTETTFTLVYSF